MGATEVEHVNVSAAQQGRRLDNFLLTHLKGVPKSRIYSIIRRGEVRVNSKRFKPSERINAGDTIRIPPLIRSSRRKRIPQQDLIDKINNSIIYKDKGFIVLNKPRGIASHGGSQHNFGVIEVLQYTMQSKEIYLVHRLDIETTGVLIIALSINLLREVNKLWHNKDCRKLYLLKVYGCWKEQEKQVVSYLVKSYKSGEFLMEEVINEDNKYQTEFINHNKSTPKKAITFFRLKKQSKDYSLLEAELITGRTHQIRLQCAKLSHPILGDKKYSFMAGIKEPERELALHCHKISLEIGNKQYEWIAPLPKILTD